MTNLENFIQIFDGILSFDFCNSIINEYQNDNWNVATLERGLNSQIRSCKGIWISNQENIKQSDTRSHILETIHDATTKCLIKYSELFPKFKVTYNTGYDLLKYDVGDFYKEHVDNFTDSPRIATICFFLNDNYTGGQFNFFDKKISIDAKMGSALIFPSNFMFPHEVTEILSGTRYSIITWFR